jgi:hypothetical protein
MEDNMNITSCDSFAHFNKAREAAECIRNICIQNFSYTLAEPKRSIIMDGVNNIFKENIHYDWEPFDTGTACELAAKLRYNIAPAICELLAAHQAITGTNTSVHNVVNTLAASLNRGAEKWDSIIGAAPTLCIA